MGAAYGVGLILIYLLVVAQFKSYLTPLIIMAPIPLTIIGVMPGMRCWARSSPPPHDRHDRAGRHHRAQLHPAGGLHRAAGGQGVAFKDAVVQSAAVRAQPIVLTGLAAMIGAFFILDDPIFNGLAISLIFGIAVSTC
jgi:multidrug efflux pump subunit AcrB